MNRRDSLWRTRIGTIYKKTKIITPSTSSTPTTTSTTDVLTENELKAVEQSLEPKPKPVPGLKWVAKWSLQRVTSTPISGDRLFQELALDKIKRPQGKVKKTPKRDNIY